LDRCDGGDRWRCTNLSCRYSTTRERIVEMLLHERSEMRELMERYVRLSLPAVIRDLYGDSHACTECERKRRQAMVTALDRAEALDDDA
jgi:hypothetical protein